MKKFITVMCNLRVPCHMSMVTCHLHIQPEPQTLHLLTLPLCTIGFFVQTKKNPLLLKTKKFTRCLQSIVKRCFQNETHKHIHTTDGHGNLETESAQWANSVRTMFAKQPWYLLKYIECNGILVCLISICIIYLAQYWPSLNFFVPKYFCNPPPFLLYSETV